jgi:GNAT superfamily N-acetyltransferase
MGHISERVSHLPPLFGMAGYAIPEIEVFFHWPNFDPPQVPEPDLGFDLVCEERQVERRGTEITVLAKQGDQRVGECKMSSLSGDSWRPQFADWCACDDLCVSEPLQGKGLGKYLLARGLTEMRRAGCRHALINTDWDNYRAYLFYTNFGYRFLDRTFGFRKELGDERSPA